MPEDLYRGRMPGHRLLIPAIAAFGGLALLASPAGAVPPVFAAPVAVGTVSFGDLKEASGVVASRSGNVLWTHNDAGGGPRIYAIDTTGRLLGFYDLPKATRTDYEDIAIGPGPATGVSYLYVGDIGDNNSVRASIQIYRVPEPAVYARQATAPVVVPVRSLQRIDLTYPDGPHNAETLLDDPVTGDLFVVTKQPGVARVYRAPRALLDAGGPVALTFVQQIDFDVASGGDISPNGDEIVIRQENFARLWTRAPGQTVDQALAGAPVAVPVVGTPTEPNGEAIGFDALGSGYYTLSDSASTQPLYRFDRAAPWPVTRTVLVGGGETWRYLDTGADLGTAWRAAGFADAGWKAGAGQLGYGDKDEATTVGFGTNAKAKFLTTYFRRTVTVADPAAFARLELKLLADDGAAVYVNGVEVARRNLPAGATATTRATVVDDVLEDTWTTIDLPVSVLVAGANTIAVEVHQATPDSPDLSFDAQLIGYGAR